MSKVAERLQSQAVQCAQMGSPLMGRLLSAAAEDYEAGGVVHELLAPFADEPPGRVLPLRFAGSVHRLVLEGKAPELARHYPSVGGTAPVHDLWPAAERACREHLEELRQLVTRPVQTNEVGRSAALYGALLMIGGPIRLLEIGASAGLNLRCDAYAYPMRPPLIYGDRHSELRFVEPWTGSIKPALHPPQIGERKGCDPRPLDVSTLEGRLTLTSYVWADQLDRLERLRTAIKMARRVPAPVEQAGALEFLSRELSELPEGTTTVVWHSLVWQYVDPAERAAVNDVLSAAGSLATDTARLARVSLEPYRLLDDVTFPVRVQTWPGRERVYVAEATGHGPPVRWLGASLAQ